MLESTRAAINATASLFPSKLNVALAGREIIDLGPVDVVSVEKGQGCVEVMLRERDNTRRGGILLEILPIGADNLRIQAPKMLAGVPEARRAPPPEPIAPEPGRSYMHQRIETAYYQIAPAPEHLEMVWTETDVPRAVRCTVTTGQVDALVQAVADVLATFTPEDHKARLVDCTHMGSARQLTEADGELPVGVFAQITTPAK